MANGLYASGREAFLSGQIDFLGDTINMALVSDAYTPDLDADTFWDGVEGDVIGTPQALTSKTATGGVANCDNVTFTAVTGTVGFIVIYKDSGTSSTSQLIACFDTAAGLPITSSGADITINIDTGANKLFKL